MRISNFCENSANICKCCKIYVAKSKWAVYFRLLRRKQASTFGLFRGREDPGVDADCNAQLFTAKRSLKSTTETDFQVFSFAEVRQPSLKIYHLVRVCEDTALHVACTVGAPDVVYLIVENGPQPRDPS